MEIDIDIKRVLDLTISLMGEENHKSILNRILKESMDLSGADAGTLYILRDDKLHFYIMRNNTMKSYLMDDEIKLPPVGINESTVSGYSAIHKEIVNIKDVYNDNKFNWDGPKKYDKLTGYHTKSQLVIPLIDNQGSLIGVIQLINATIKGEITYFSKDIEYVIYSLASISAIMLSNKMLLDNIQTLLRSFVKAMTAAIDSRTPYNAHHTINVSKLCVGFIDYLNSECGYKISSDEKDELNLAAMLHDVGKMIVPLAILNKKDRLADMLDKLILRYEAISLNIDNMYLAKEIDSKGHEEMLKYVDEALEFIKRLNETPYLSDENRNRVMELSKVEYKSKFGPLRLINDDELNNLLIKKGTLNDEERKIVNMHAEFTNRILSEIDFGNKYKNVLYIASSHHEYLDGSGYPKGLKGDEITTPVRILTIMDVYESLTSTDRPYKKPMSSERAYQILVEMTDEGKLDRRRVSLFGYYLKLL